MQIKAATAMSGGGGGQPTWELYTPSGGDGKPGLIAVLMNDYLQGKLYSDAYVSGTQCQVYCPIAGEHLNVRFGETAGTGNSVTIGDMLMANATGGYLIPNSSGVATPFISMETLTLQAAGILLWCVFTGA